jgi:hypothetical protein
MKAAAAAPILSASRREARGTAIDIDDGTFLEVREEGKLKPAAKPPTSCSANMMLREAGAALSRYDRARGEKSRNLSQPRDAESPVMGHGARRYDGACSP